MPLAAITSRLRQSWRAFALAVRRVVMLEDIPERIARGCGAGMFCAWLPMLGQTFAGMLLAWCIRGSPLAAIPWSWITNPLTTLPIWYGCYRLGAALIPGHEAVTWDGLRAIVEQVEAMSLVDGMLHGVEVLGGVFLPLLLGSVLIGIVTAIPTWWLVRRAVAALQARRAARVAHWKTRLPPTPAPEPEPAPEPPPATDVDTGRHADR
jgi:uncharacterized protein